jgi:hypothetical protein
MGYNGSGTQTATIATHLPERDEKGHHQWQMDNGVAEALELLGWVSPSEDDPAVVEDPLFPFEDVPETEREAVTKARKGQGLFRNEVVALWICLSFGSCCAPLCAPLFRDPAVVDFSGLQPSRWRRRRAVA